MVRPWDPVLAAVVQPNPESLCNVLTASQPHGGRPAAGLVTGATPSQPASQRARAELGLSQPARHQPARRSDCASEVASPDRFMQQTHSQEGLLGVAHGIIPFKELLAREKELSRLFPSQALVTVGEDVIASYRELGYAKIEGVLSPDEVAALQVVVDNYLESSRSAETHSDVFDLEPGHAHDTPKLRRIKNPGRNHPLFRRMIRHPVIVDIVEQFFGRGRGVRTNGDKLNMKSPGHGSPVQWHRE